MIHSCKACAKRNHCIYKPMSDVADCGYFVSGTQEKKQTWGDKIRAMSDEELADFLKQYMSCGFCDARDRTNGCKDCRALLFQWLKSEVEE